MKNLIKIFLIILCLTSPDVWAAKRKATQTKRSDNIVAPKKEEKKAETIQKYECGYARPLRVASGMLGNAPFAWEEYANIAHTKFTSYGLGLKVIEDLSKKLGFNYVSTGFPTYEEAVKALKRGEVDVLFSVYYTKLGTGTKAIYPGYFTNPFVTYVKKGSEAEANLKDVKSFKDLEGWNGVVREEEQIYPVIKNRVKNLKLKPVLSAQKVFEMLLNGEADYLIGSPYSLEAELRRQKLQNDIVPIGDTLEQAGLFFTFSTNTNCSQLAKDFSQTMSENGLTKAEMDTLIRQMVDDWGNRFREEEGFLDKQKKEEQVKKAEETAPKNEV